MAQRHVRKAIRATAAYKEARAEYREPHGGDLMFVLLWLFGGVFALCMGDLGAALLSAGLAALYVIYRLRPRTRRHLVGGDVRDIGGVLLWGEYARIWEHARFGGWADRLLRKVCEEGSILELRVAARSYRGMLDDEQLRPLEMHLGWARTLAELLKRRAARGGELDSWLESLPDERLEPGWGSRVRDRVGRLWRGRRRRLVRR